MKKRKILIVCMWPLGGIRTYLKYNYQYFPRDRFDITLLAYPGVESEAIEADMESLGIRVIWAKPMFGKNIMFLRVLQLLLKQKFDLIHSQGFTAAIHTSIVNRLFGKPHVLTIHGVIEEKLFKGTFGRLKRWLFKHIVSNVDVFHGVGEDILNHVKQTVPQKLVDRKEWIVIRNGIDTKLFLKDYPDAGKHLRETLCVDSEIFVFGCFGRFMPEKGFRYIIEAVKLIIDKEMTEYKFMVMAVGSGDYESSMKRRVEEYNLAEYFYFHPFSSKVTELMQGCDIVVMPSIWEAYPLLSSEVLCCGVPIIASDCVGLREAVADTPALNVKSGDAESLMESMITAMSTPNLKEPFTRFRQEAVDRFDVKNFAEKLVALFDRLCEPSRTK